MKTSTIYAEIIDKWTSNKYNDRVKQENRSGVAFTRAGRCCCPTQGVETRITT